VIQMPRNSITPGQTGQRYRIELSRTSNSPAWWEYQIIENSSGLLVAGGEVRGARHLALLAGQREALKLERAAQPFYIPPVSNSYRIPC
jgi:hypothetical protein